MAMTSKSLMRHLFLLLFFLSASGCAVLAPKSNDQKLAKISGADVVISVPKTTVDLDAVSPVVKKDQSVFRLVSERDYPAAVRSNGNKLSGPVQLTDPSLSITNALARYYQKTYEFRFVAKGSIKNIDPKFIQSALKKGDYVLDVRLTELSLQANNNQQFYPQGAFVLSVIDRQKGKNTVQDTCRFAAVDKADTMRTYTQNNGLKLNQILKTYAGHCLQYFAKGTPLPVTAQVATRTPITDKDRIDQVGFARAAVGSSITIYPQYSFGEITLTGLDASLTLGNRLSPTMGWRVQSGIKLIEDGGFPSFSADTIYAGVFAVGAELYPSGDDTNAFAVSVVGQSGQTRLKGVLLSTNAIGVNLEASRRLVWKLRGTAGYTYLQHVGPTEESNVGGHELRASLSYEF